MSEDIKHMEHINEKDVVEGKKIFLDRDWIQIYLTIINAYYTICSKIPFFPLICKRSQQQIKWNNRSDQAKPNIDSNKDTETHTCIPSSAVSMHCNYSLNEFVKTSYWSRYVKLGICFRFAIFHQFSWFWWILFVKFRIPHMENCVN